MKKHLTLLGVIFFSASLCAAQQHPMGMATALENDSILYASGFKLIGTTVEKLISPTMPDSLFEEKVRMVRNMQCRVIMCNVLFPGKIKIAGPEVNETEVLNYLEAVLVRAKKAGVPNLILGSGGARRLPENYDMHKAKTDFIALAKKMADLAKRFDITIILENLNSTETNFLNRLKDAAEVVRAVDHENFRLNSDIYHMMKEDESPEEIVRAGKLIVYCEIAEEEGRTLPGINKQDFRPYLRALKQIGFTGPIMIEGNTKDLQTDLPIAMSYLQDQLREVYEQK